jgi:hypothetical protein
LSRLCVELKKSERFGLRKIARDLWDNVVSIFTDSVQVKRPLNSSSSSMTNKTYDASNFSNVFTTTQQASSVILRESNTSSLNRVAFRELLLNIRNKHVITILLSLLCTLYNIGDSTVNHEIFSDYRYLWPSSLANCNSLNLQCLIDLLQEFTDNCLNNIDSFHISWHRSLADIYIAEERFSDALKTFLQLITCETKYFFINYVDSLKTNKAKVKSLKGSLNTSSNSNSKTKEELKTNKSPIKTTTSLLPTQTSVLLQSLNENDKKMLKSMIKSCTHLNKHTQAALLYQFLTTSIYKNNGQSNNLTGTSNSNNQNITNIHNDYASTFRILQDRSQPTADEMDLIYSCCWDMALLEYLTNFNATKGYLARRNICLKLWQQRTLINSANINNSASNSNSNASNTNINLQSSTASTLSAADSNDSLNVDSKNNFLLQMKKSNLFLQMINYYLNN